ncbi:MAG: hypothetical protein ABW196_11785, partial [Solirubrobacterales bacterium]
MKRLTLTLTTVFLAALAIAPTANAEFGIKNFELTFANEDGSPVTQAGAHPFAQSLTFEVETEENPDGKQLPTGDVKSVRFSLPPGFTGSPIAAPPCSTADFLAIDEEGYPSCPNASAVGATWSKVNEIASGEAFLDPVYNLVPPPGVAAKIGFVALTIPVTVEIGVNGEAPNNIEAAAINIPQVIRFYGSSTQLWGVPADHAHDPFRGKCLARGWKPGYGHLASKDICNTGAEEKPFLTLPRSCTGPVSASYEAVSWQQPDAAPDKGSDEAPGMTGCSKLGFSPTIGSKATTSQAETGSGLDFRVDFNDEGLTNPTGLAQSDIKKAVVALPEGMTVNPS